MEKKYGSILKIVKVAEITSLQIYAQMKEAKRFYRPGSKRTKEFLLARTMMVLVLVFLILNTPRLILGLIEVNETSVFLELFIASSSYVR